MKTLQKALIATLAVAMAGCATAPRPRALDTAPALGGAVRTVAAQTVERAALYEATGVTKAQFNSTLSSKLMARVVTVRAREGDSVRKGQTLVDLDGRELAASVDIARANVAASSAGVSNARTAREMEEKMAAARIAQAEAALIQSRAALGAAQSRLDLVLAGPRVQEKQQAQLAVIQAESTLKLAKIQLDRVAGLVEAGAMPRRNLDEAKTAYEVALAQRDSVVENQKIAQEGSRAEEVRAAKENVAQAKAAIKQAEANVSQARAAALQAKVRAEEIRVAQTQVSQTSAALRSTQVSLAYAAVVAPFEGRVARRFVDPGAMATPGSPLLMLEGGAIRLEAAVPESVVAGIRRNGRIKVRIDALGRELDARVDEIVPQGDAATHTFIVKLRLPEASILKSGMFGRAYIPRGLRRSIEIPEMAVWEREGLRYVYAVNPEGIARLRIITVGETRNGNVAVLSGLSPGELVVVEGRERVTDGVKVVTK